MTLAEAIKQTEAAAWAYAKALRAAKDAAWFSSDERKQLDDARTIQVGRVTVSALIGGNTRRQHCRHNFKVDGKRAAYSEASALEITGQNN